MEHIEDENLYCRICDGEQLDGPAVGDIITEMASIRSDLIRELGKVEKVLAPLKERHKEIMSLHRSCSACSILVGVGHVVIETVRYRGEDYCHGCAEVAIKRDKLVAAAAVKAAAKAAKAPAKAAIKKGKKGKRLAANAEGGN
tara:strand:- start:21 stop:449 length:429 start_codon:yes stop_codon:yes gene_type:complete